MKIVLNTVDKGEFYLRMAEERDILIPASTVRDLGISVPPEKAGMGEEYISLRSLAPDVVFTLEENEATLLLTVNPELLPTQMKDFARGRRPGVLYPQTDSLFINYGFEYADQQKMIDVPLELSGRLGSLLLLSSANACLGDQSGLVRNMTSLVIDERESQVRAVLGDFSAASPDLGLTSSAVLGGVSITKKFSLDPYSLRTPSLTLRDLLSLPSTVRIFINGVPIGDSMRMSPGKLELSHLPLFPGANTVSLVTTDSNGHTTRIEVPYYYSSNLLASGIDEFGYNIGFARKDLGLNSFSYGEPTFLGFHRLGVTDWLTAGGFADVSKAAAKVGTLTAFTLGPLGELSTSLAVSSNQGTIGYGAVADYSYQTAEFGISLDVKYLSDAYSTSLMPWNTMTSSFVGSLATSFNNIFAGSLLVSASHSATRDGTASEAFSIGYSHPLWRNAQVQTLLGGQVQQRKLQLWGFVGVHYLLGDALANLTYAAQPGSNRISASIQRSVPLGNGLGYAANLDGAQSQQGNATLAGSAELSYHGPQGIYSASASYGQGQNQPDFELSTAGSLVFVDHTFHFAQPITDSFALVRADGLEGVRVKYGNRYVGVTDPAGTLIVPYLASNNENQIEIEQSDIPMDYRIESAESYLSPPYRGGGVVDFAPVKFKALAGRLFFVEKGRRMPAEYAGLEVTVAGHVMSSVVGIGGAFYLENVPKGTFHARVFTEDKESTFMLVVPDGKETVVDLGEIDCKVER